MKGSILILLCILLMKVSSCKSQSKVAGVTIDTRPVAFKGAEGFGKYSTGGRGGKVMIVSNLNDDGEGSFRKAAEGKGKRIIVFSVSGTIHLLSKLTIKGDVTIAGQSAPGDGICFADYPVSLGGDNIIIRYLRFRMGDKNQKGGKVNGSGSDDAFGGVRRKNIIIDHCSLSWSTDEVVSIYAGDSTTVQWNIISEPLNYSYHFETGDTDYEQHGYGGIWGGRHFTAHHNLFAHCNNRNPRFDGIRNSPEESVDYRNNVIYNWGINTIYAGEGGNYNVVDNYFKYGPSTKSNARYRIVSPGKTEIIPFGKWYVAGNIVDGSETMTKDNSVGVFMGNGGNEIDKQQALVSLPHPSVRLPEQKAGPAFESVLNYAGASHKRDTLDSRIVADVKDRTGRFIDVQGGYPHGTSYEQTVAAWPALKSLPASTDADKDGMADEWEKAQGLNISLDDSAGYDLSKQLTNVEVYLQKILE